MKFRITFKNVSGDELPELIDRFAGRSNTVTVSSGKNSNTFTVSTDWREDLDAEAESFRHLHGVAR